MNFNNSQARLGNTGGSTGPRSGARSGVEDFNAYGSK